MKPTIIAHRGYSKAAPENTIAAFTKAIEEKTDFIECDIQFTKDLIPVIFHDTYLNRTTNSHQKKQLFQLSLKELRLLSAGSWFAKEFENETIPTFSELLQLAYKKIGLMMEIKKSFIDSHKVVEILVNAANKFDLFSYPNFFATSEISIFKSLMKIMDPCHLIGIVTSPKLIDPFLASGIEHLAIDYHFLNIPFLKMIPKKNKIWAWTVDDPEVAYSLVKIGISGIITNDPKTITDALKDE